MSAVLPSSFSLCIIVFHSATCMVSFCEVIYIHHPFSLCIIVFHSATPCRKPPFHTLDF
jgi:hypothetical protein